MLKYVVCVNSDTLVLIVELLFLKKTICFQSRQNALIIHILEFGKKKVLLEILSQIINKQ